MYTGDIVISADETRLNQLVLLLQISTPIQKPFRLLQVTIALPGEETPRTIDLTALLPPVMPLPDRTRVGYKVPVHIASPTLKAGPIDIRLTHDEGEMVMERQWVMGPTQAQEFQKLMQAATTPRN